MPLHKEWGGGSHSPLLSDFFFKNFKLQFRFYRHYTLQHLFLDSIWRSTAWIWSGRFCLSQLSVVPTRLFAVYCPCAAIIVKVARQSFNVQEAPNRPRLIFGANSRLSRVMGPCDIVGVILVRMRRPSGCFAGVSGGPSNLPVEPPCQEISQPSSTPGRLRDDFPRNYGTISDVIAPAREFGEGQTRFLYRQESTKEFQYGIYHKTAFNTMLIHTHVLRDIGKPGNDFSMATYFFTLATCFMLLAMTLRSVHISAWVTSKSSLTR